MFGWFGFICCGDIEDTEAPPSSNLALKPRWKSASAVSLRGHLVRTYNHDIENDFYMDRDHELGKGGCGVVVVGEHKETRQQYAIKIVNKATAERGRLDRELKLMKDVDHTNIVRLFSVYDVPGHMYFVMELCLGGHLGNLLSRQPQKHIDEKWAKNLCRQMLSAVAHIHGRGIAHRDIKLQNILIDSTNDRTAQLKLIDFGYGSRFVGALPMRTKCGTPYTTAPEVIRECYDERCDIWSCGVVLYIMLCGRRPFEALDIGGPLSDAGKAAMIANILAGRYHFNHKPFQSTSKAAINFVKTLLHQDYKTRIRAYEALENPWFHDTQIIHTQTTTLTSAKSFRAINNIRRSSLITDMQRAGMVALVFGINARSAADLRSIFQSFDRDGSGTISKTEFHEAIKLIMPELSPDDVNRLFDIVDIDRNQTISYTEFLAATLDPREVDLDELNKAFKLLDEDGNGYITKDELRKVVKVMVEQARTHENNSSSKEPSLTLREEYLSTVLDEDLDTKVNEIFSQVDVNGDGRISLEEFFLAMTGGQVDSYAEQDYNLSSKISAKAVPFSGSGKKAGNNNQLEDGGSRRSSLTTTALTSSTRHRNNSYAAPAGTMLFGTETDEPDDGNQLGSMGGGMVNGGGGGGMSHRHSIAAIRMSSTRIPRIVETSEHASSSAVSSSQVPDLTAADPSQISLAHHNNNVLPPAMVGRSSSHRSAGGRERVLPVNDDFEGSAQSSPRPQGKGSIVIYDDQAYLPGSLVHNGTHGETGDHIDELNQQDPSSSSCGSYDNAKVRELFGSPKPFFETPRTAMGTSSRKMLLPPLASLSHKVVDVDSSLGVEYDEKSEAASRGPNISASGRSASLGRALIDNSSGPSIRISNDTNFRENPSQVLAQTRSMKKTPSLKRELSSRVVMAASDLSMQSVGEDDRRGGMTIMSQGRGGSLSSILKNRGGGELALSAGDVSSHSQGKPGLVAEERRDSGLMASFSRIIHSNKYS